MCGRFTLTIELDVLFERFEQAYSSQLSMSPSYNIAPTHSVLAVVRGEKGNKIGRLRWGLVPAWAKDPSIGAKMINARSETLHEKPSFKSLIHRQRCLVIADSFYEWQKTEKHKQPYRIQLKNGEPFSFAGLWSVWQSGHETLATCTIITAQANAFMSPLHDRMPVILSQKDEALWLDPNRPFQDVKGLLTSFPTKDMHMYPVSTKVNHTRFNDEELVRPIHI
ncbi:SOS response-associated peptidase [Pullulanibacillus sp. KACC 23026]|uniref:SOS response-associated peptidase n=1 Tax=Pullulanibacillus sp. KACC 23026 TaxID=3028315 RepID=UPI0023AEBB67|nr:SOS response-associated peptidase [Pullulanibacillus sp. KACC 23026]WEG12271.1 SOS response-associated peptidase [Pullulanibacillus sp. KACC 23026]